MTLVAGARLGPYEITGQIGAGGMGVVYRARDTRLGREVAIKALPDALAADPERLARFDSQADDRDPSRVYSSPDPSGSTRIL